MQQVNDLLFLPLYFVYTGLHTQVRLINSPLLWLVCLLVLITACAGKIFGGALSSRWAGLSSSWREALSLGVLMNARGLVELIVLNIGLNIGILSPTLFAMLVLMAIITTIMASSLLPLLSARTENQPNTQEITAGSASWEETTSTQ
jgi:Kef-type K+ transport system membrane component KefB